MMKNIIYILLAVIAITFGITSFAGAQQSKLQSIDAQALMSLMDKSEKIILIDSRSVLECMDSKIPGALCLSCDEKKDTAIVSSLDKNSRMVFYAGSIPLDPNCPLLTEAIKQGFAHVYVLQGGLQAWRQAGHPVVLEKRIPRMFSLAVNPRNFSEWRKQAKNPLVIDIRPANAYAKDHLEAAVNFPLTRLHIQYADIPLDRTLLIVDEDGTESFLTASYLARKGFLNIQRLKGGMASYRRGAR